MKKIDFENIEWEKELNEVPDCVHQAVVKANEKVLSEKNVVKHKFKRKAFIPMVAASALVFGVTAYAAISAWQLRMEAMSQEEKKQHIEEIYATNQPFRYSRNMTTEEKERENTLRQLYEEEGLFPEKELMLMSFSEYKQSGVALDIEKHLLCMPDRELTDEEILEIIDYFEKADYSLRSVDENKNPITEGIVDSAVDKEEPRYQGLNYQSYPYEGEATELYSVWANGEAIYVNTGNAIERINMGETKGEVVYETSEQDRLISFMADEENNLYLSLQHKDADSDEIEGRLIKVSSEGELLLEYDLEYAYASTGESLMENYAYKMMLDDNGQLYFKTRNDSGNDLLYVFDEEGKLYNTFNFSEYSTHESDDFFMGKDHKLYLMAYKGNEKVLLQIQPGMKIIEKEISIVSNEMNYPTDCVYQISNEEFIFVSWDGILSYNAATQETNTLIKGYEELWFTEGCSFAKIDEHRLLIKYGVDKGYEFVEIEFEVN